MHRPGAAVTKRSDTLFRCARCGRALTPIKLGGARYRFECHGETEERVVAERFPARFTEIRLFEDAPPSGAVDLADHLAGAIETELRT